MAKKKEPSIADGVELFKDVMKRSTLTDFIYLNRILLGKTSKDANVLVIPDQTLWNALLEDEEFKTHISELDISDPEQFQMNEKFSYGNGIENSGWVEINAETMYAGEMVNITIDGFKYEIPVNKGLFPTKLKKAEYSNFAYKIYTDPKLALALKKKFDGPVDDSSFTIMRAFIIL